LGKRTDRRKEAVERSGGEVFIIPFVKKASTSNLIETILKRYEKAPEKICFPFRKRSPPSDSRCRRIPLHGASPFCQPGESIKSLEEALSKDRLIFLVAQKKLSEEDPSPKDLYKVGTVAAVMKMLKLPDGKVKILIQGLSKASVKETLQTTPYLLVRVENIKDPFITGDYPLKREALMRNVREQLERIVSYGKPPLPGP